MNISRVISSIIMQFGLYGVALPFKDPETGDPIPTENVIRDVITITTIPEYSQFCPWKREGTIRLDSLRAIDKKNGKYMLPAYLTLTDVMYVIDVEIDTNSDRSAYDDIDPLFFYHRSPQVVATGQAYTMLTGQMRPEPSFDYLGHNQIKLYNYPNTNLIFKVACCHESNGETIPESCYDSFMELATLDVKVFLYNHLDLFDDMPTAFGPIKLKIEKYQGAEAERNTLLDRWRDTFHVDMGWEEWM